MRRYASEGASYGLSVCVNQFITSWSSIKTDRWIELVFGMEASFDLSYSVL